MDFIVPNNYTKIYEFLVSRNIEFMLNMFILQKIDDTVASSIETKKLDELGLVFGDVIAFRNAFPSSESTTCSYTYKERADELLEKLKRPHRKNKEIRIPSYNLTVRLKCCELVNMKKKYVLKNRSTFIFDARKDLQYDELHFKAREFFQIAEATPTFIGDYKNEETIEPHFINIESFAIQRKSCKRGLIMYLYCPKAYSTLVVERAKVEDWEDDGPSTTTSIQICSVCGCTYTNKCIRCEQNTAYVNSLITDVMKSPLDEFSYRPQPNCNLNSSLLAYIEQEEMEENFDLSTGSAEDDGNKRLRRCHQRPIRYRHSIGYPTFPTTRSRSHSPEPPLARQRRDQFTSPTRSPSPELLPVEDLRQRRIAAFESHRVESNIEIESNESNESHTIETEEEKNITIHRATLKDEMMKIFSDPKVSEFKLNFKVVDFRGDEEAEIGVGVTRDILSSYFEDFFISCTTGYDEKVPAIRHDMQMEQWKAVGRIIVYAAKLNCFPISLSKTPIIVALFGEAKLKDKTLIDSFLRVISSDEKEMIEELLTKDYESTDDLLEFLSAYNCRRVPGNLESFKVILKEIAHQELLQKPKYIISCFANVWQGMSLPEPFQDEESLLNMYQLLKPSSRGIIKIIKAGDLTEQRRVVFNHLVKFIKSLQPKELGKFLKFVTGSENLPEEIVLHFTQQNPRAPRARTCGSILELSEEYDNYNEFQEEFYRILQNEYSFAYSFV